MNAEAGWLLENLVFNTIKPAGDVYYFSAKNECDFILFKNKKVKQIIQVTYELADHNRDREINGLLEAMQYFNLNTGLILTFDQEMTIELTGKTISVQPVWKWLLE